MTKGKVTLGDYEMNGFVFIGMMLLLIFCSIILGISMTKDNNININIPNTRIINSFCKSNGYEYGWLSSTSCGINEVECFRQVGDAKYYDCLKFISVKP